MNEEMATTSGKIVELDKAYLPAPEIHKADESALGSLPVDAYRYCEPIRTATSYAWYVYPPKDVSLLFDGRETLFFEDDQWYPLKSYNFEPSFREHWNTLAPNELRDNDPPFITELSVPGLVQVWSGYFVTTATGWSLSIGNLANLDVRSSISLYEAIVDTDLFCPMPLFVNFRICKTDSEIFLSKDRPLFQIRPVLRDSLKIRTNDVVVKNGLNEVSWSGLKDTIRTVEGSKTRSPGTYAAFARKRKRKSES